MRRTIYTKAAFIAVSLGLAGCNNASPTNDSVNPSDNATTEAAREAAREMHNEMSENATSGEQHHDMDMNGMGGMGMDNMQGGSMGNTQSNSMNSSMPMEDDSGHM